MTEKVCISEAQRDFHIATEAASLFLMAPFMFYLATRKTLDPVARKLCFVAGVGIVLVDGGLLAKWPSLRGAQ